MWTQQDLYGSDQVFLILKRVGWVGLGLVFCTHMGTFVGNYKQLNQFILLILIYCFLFKKEVEKQAFGFILQQVDDYAGLQQNYSRYVFGDFKQTKGKKKNQNKTHKNRQKG
eukprot:TRINITY_DN5719_c1_g1_i4.p5 TRINITY_DN5719_c1_g1~~TRINITY_DN5719_c1_g1_i4.p5  ORF type:complete len:112 (-),score=8.93 TRINITY_DN5719_c1_g1_i4:22-357(-)